MNPGAFQISERPELLQNEIADWIYKEREGATKTRLKETWKDEIESQSETAFQHLK